MNSTIKTILRLISIAFFIGGGIFFLQGINILPGSYMTGDPQWAINGSIIMLLSAGLFWFVNRK